MEDRIGRQNYYNGCVKQYTEFRTALGGEFSPYDAFIGFALLKNGFGYEEIITKKTRIYDLRHIIYRYKRLLNHGYEEQEYEKDCTFRRFSRSGQLACGVLAGVMDSMLYPLPSEKGIGIMSRPGNIDEVIGRFKESLEFRSLKGRAINVMESSPLLADEVKSFVGDFFFLLEQVPSESTDDLCNTFMEFRESLRLYGLPVVVPGLGWRSTDLYGYLHSESLVKHILSLLTLEEAVNGIHFPGSFDEKTLDIFAPDKQVRDKKLYEDITGIRKRQPLYLSEEKMAYGLTCMERKKGESLEQFQNRMHKFREKVVQELITGDQRIVVRIELMREELCKVQKAARQATGGSTQIGYLRARLPEIKYFDFDNPCLHEIYYYTFKGKDKW